MNSRSCTANSAGRAGYLRKILLSLAFYFLITVPAASARGYAATLDDLIISLRSHDYCVQLSAVEALGRRKDNRAVNALLDFIFTRAEDWRLKIRAIRLLGEIPDYTVSDKLVTILNDPFLNEECPAMKWNAATALGHRFNKGTRAVGVLIEALSSDHLLIKEAAVTSLGQIGDSRALPFLITELKSTHFAIRFSAVRALEHIGNPEAIPYLRQVLNTDRDPMIKEAALSALQNFRPD
jgi:HEAT repeat protein